MKLSVIIICWNDSRYILDCIRSVYNGTSGLDFEIIVTDNGSTDGSVDMIREAFPQVRIIQNGANIGFGPANNAGVRAAAGDYVLILNPDTIVHPDALKRMIDFAIGHPEGGAFGCRVLNTDGSLQWTAQPEPTLLRYIIIALSMRWLGRLSPRFQADGYPGWDGRTEKTIGFQAGCALLVPRTLFESIGGFDPRFSHQFEDADLCLRLRQSGRPTLFCPDAEITHIGGYNRGSYSLSVVLETERSKCRFFHKHYGARGVRQIRAVSMLGIALRLAGYGVLRLIRPQSGVRERIANYRLLLKWYRELNPSRFIENGEEPDVIRRSLCPAPQAG